MTLSFDITEAFIKKIEGRLDERMSEIDSHLDRLTIEDQSLNLLLCAAKKAGYGKKKKAHA